MSTTPTYIPTTIRRNCQDAIIVANASQYATPVTLASALGSSGREYQGVIQTEEDRLREAAAGPSDLGTDALPGVARGEAPACSSPSLVIQGITQHFTPKREGVTDVCRGGGGWLRGRCHHGVTRWVRLGCKRRDCPVCGEQRRNKIAYRIGHGIEVLGGGDGGAWFVGSFKHDVTKKEAIKVQAKFIRWVRRYLKGRGRVEYAVTWEVTRRGRLHVNIIMCPWSFVSQGVLSQKWERFGGGKVVWIERVGAGVGVEAAKSKRAVGDYLGKFEQMVRTGKGVTYSKGWPDLPAAGCRHGEVSWSWVGDMSVDAILFGYERQLGHWSSRVATTKSRCFASWPSFRWWMPMA